LDEEISFYEKERQKKEFKGTGWQAHALQKYIKRNCVLRMGRLKSLP